MNDFQIYNPATGDHIAITIPANYGVYCSDCNRFVPVSRFGFDTCALCESVRADFMSDVAAIEYNSFDR